MKARGGSAGSMALPLPASVVRRAPGSPVAIIGGIATRRRDYESMRAFVESIGRRPVHVPTQDTGFRPILEDAEVLARLLDRLRWLSSGEPVDIVAHSKGGVAARAYLQLMDGVENVGTLVTLGTPHSGIATARLGAQLASTARLARRGMLAEGDRSSSGTAIVLRRLKDDMRHATLPPAVRDLRGRSRTMVTLERDFPAFVERAKQNPEFRLRAVAGDISGGIGPFRGDGVVGLRSARLPVEDGVQFHNVVVEGLGASHRGLARPGPQARGWMRHWLGAADD